MEKTLSDYQKAIEASLEDISKITFNAELLAANEALVHLSLRTFAAGGKGVKDVSGKEISGYVKPKLIQGKYGMKKDKYGTWAEKRMNAGLQTAHKDLNFTGELMRSMTTGLHKDRPAMGITTEQATKIIEGTEEREKAAIFQLNADEVSKIKETVKNSVMDAIKKMAEGWNK